MNDLTVVYTTANEIRSYFATNVRHQLLKAIGDTPLISVSKKPLDFGFNLNFGAPRSHVNIYRELLDGVKLAETKYIAIAEDDTLYAPEHFKHRPSRPGVFAYNIGVWGIYTWNPEVFSWKGRRNMNGLICERDLFIEAMEERFAKWPDDSKIDNGIFAEPGKYEKQLGVTIRETETFYTNPANIMFSHDDGLSHHTLGHKKRLGELRALSLPYWGSTFEVMNLYE